MTCAMATWCWASCARHAKSERHYGLLKVESINGVDPEIARKRPHSKTLPRFSLKNASTWRPIPAISTRLINLIVPSGAASVV